MSAEPLPEPALARRALPDYLPARKINEFVYCPRLFYFEQVEDVFVHNAHTLEGAAQHKRVDQEGRSAPKPDEETQEPVVVRSITLSSEEHRVIAKLDLAEFADGLATPVDYKHGRPMKWDEGLQAWPERTASNWPSRRWCCAPTATAARRASFSTRKRGRGCASASTTKRWPRRSKPSPAPGRPRRRPRFLRRSWTRPNAPAVRWSASACRTKWGQLQSPRPVRAAQQLGLFEDGRKIPRKPPGKATRLLVAPRADLKPLYLNTQGLRVGKTGGVLRIKERDKVVQDARIHEICQVNLMGNIQITTQAVQELCRDETPICYFSQGGWFYGVTTGLNTKNVLLRRAQFRLAEEEWFLPPHRAPAGDGQDSQSAHDADAQSHRASRQGAAPAQVPGRTRRGPRIRWTSCSASKAWRRGSISGCSPAC